MRLILLHEIISCLFVMITFTCLCYFWQSNIGQLVITGLRRTQGGKRQYYVSISEILGTLKEIKMIIWTSLGTLFYNNTMYMQLTFFQQTRFTRTDAVKRISQKREKKICRLVIWMNIAFLGGHHELWILELILSFWVKIDIFYSYWWLT